MASRSLLSNVGSRGARGHRRFDREREARHHERHLVARGGQSLVHEAEEIAEAKPLRGLGDRKSTRLNSSHSQISYAVFCLKKKKTERSPTPRLTAGTRAVPHTASGDHVPH